MAINWLEPRRDLTIFADETFAREEFFKSAYEFQEDKKEQEEEQRERQREGNILTESDAVPVAKKLRRRRTFIPTAGHDFVPINWSEESDSEFETSPSDTSRCSGQHQKLSDTGKRAGKVASGPLLFSDSPLKGEGREDYFRVVNYFSPAMTDGFNLEDFGNSGLDDTIEWATDQSACGSEGSVETPNSESSESSASHASSVCNEDELDNNVESCFCTFADESPPATDKEEAEEFQAGAEPSRNPHHGVDSEQQDVNTMITTGEQAECGRSGLRSYLENLEEDWQDECSSTLDEEPACFPQSRECRKRHFEWGEDINKLPCAAKRRCLVCVIEDSLSLQQQTHSTGNELNNNSLPLVASHSEGQESSGEGSSVSFVDCLESFPDSDSETESDDSMEWATATENQESSGWETAREDELDGSVAAENEEESDMETSKSCSPASLASDEMQSNSVTSLSYFADVESSSGEETSTFSSSRENSLAAAEFNIDDSSKPASRKSFRNFFSWCGRVGGETQETPRRVRKRKNIFTGFICALIVKRNLD